MNAEEPRSARKRRTKFASAERASWIAFAAFLAVSPLYAWCQLTHYCMGGHLPDHPALGHSHATTLAFLLDGLWTVVFGAVAILAFFSGITFRYVFVFALGIGFLFVADPRGIGEILIWPVLVATCLFAIASLRGWID